MVDGSGNGRREDLLFEAWKVALDTGRHFNDLLVRVRAVALPILVAAGGLASSIDFERDVSMPAVLPAFALLVPGVALLLTLWLVRNYQSDRPSEDQEESRALAEGVQIPSPNVRGVEFTLYTLIGIELVAVGLWGLVRVNESGGVTESVAVGVGPALLWGSLFMIAAIHLLDRHYYYRLLLGAVRRATLLEVEMGQEFRLTSDITRFTPPMLASVAITALYVVPVVYGVGTLGVLFVIST